MLSLALNCVHYLLKKILYPRLYGSFPSLIKMYNGVLVTWLQIVKIPLN